MRFGTPEDKNFGFGNKLAYAGHNALKASYSGHFATVAAHSERFKQFSHFVKQNQNISDAHKITTEHLKTYTKHLKTMVEQGKMSVSTAQNRISSVNVTLEAMREDRAVRVAPSVVGARDNVRTTEPKASNERAVQRFSDQAKPRERVVMEMARNVGTREREAVLMNYTEALKEAKSTGRITITEGTKGARGKNTTPDVIRQVEISHEAMRTLERGAVLQGDRQNLISEGETWKQANNRLHGRSTRESFKSSGLAGYHDGRSAYACQRYLEITGYKSPCVAGQRISSKSADREARAVISRELGHGDQRQIVSYIGSAA